jgi:hypothetical protein
MDHFAFEPTAYEAQRQRQQKQTPKKLLAEGRKQVKIATDSYALALNKGTTGQQHAALLHIRRVSQMYGIEVQPLFQWLIALHESVAGGVDG